ncbi:hypothetical protein HWV62_19802 [Athelia sp. TMB]|nr:hypothetical protein HWV62_19802 [Athelia sp. TMB]
MELAEIKFGFIPSKKGKWAVAAGSISLKNWGPIPTPSLPPVLKILILCWKGEPSTICGDGDPDLHDFVGEYQSALPAAALRLNSWNAEREAFEYIPTSSVRFVYERHTYVGRVTSDVEEYGGTVAEDMPVKIRVCRPEQNPWPQVLLPRDASYKDNAPERPSLRGPPFSFYECDFAESYENGCFNPEQLGNDDDIINLRRPDLPGQTEEDNEAWLAGWSGTYVDDLIAKLDGKEPLGERPLSTIWSPGDQWAIEISLKALRVFESDYVPDRSNNEFEYDGDGRGHAPSGSDDEDESDDDTSLAISGYRVVATIQRVLVTAAFLESVGAS